MKRFLAIILAAMFILCSTLAAFAEDTGSTTDQLPQMEGGFPGGTPPEMPEGVVLTVDETAYTNCVLAADSLPSE